MTGIFNWARKGNGMRRSTLRALFNMDSTQLSDMGLTRYDVAEALRNGGEAGQFLTARRNARATAWLR